MPQLQALFTAEEIRSGVERLAQEVRRDYHGKYPLIVGVLKGGFVFMADLVRNLDMPLEIEFVQLSSYGKGRETSGTIKVVQGLRTPLKNRHVLVIEDIVDTGLTLRFFLDYLQRKRPASLKVCALFDKASRRQVTVPIDYLGFTIPDVFVVGYGIDWDEKFRYLPGLYFLEEGDEPKGTEGTDFSS